MNEQLIYGMVASALAKLISDGVKMKNVAEHTGLSSSTLHRFMRQETVYPRFHTVMCVLEYLGFEITIGRAKRGTVRHLRSIPETEPPKQVQRLL